MTQVTAGCHEKFYERFMTLIIPFHIWRKTLVFLGVLAACLFDLAFKARFGDAPFQLQLKDLLSLACVWLLALILMAVLLERYVRPLSHTGAIMTGFCGYALLSFLVP